MTALIKVQRVDFSASDWLGGTATLSLQECGLYIKICALIYMTGGPVTKADVRNVAASTRYETFSSILLRLIEKGKISFENGLIDQARCERELAKSRQRIADRRRTGAKSGSQTDSFESAREPGVLNDTNAVAKPHARAKVYQATKEGLESYPEPSESVAAREVSKSEKGLGRFAPSGEPHPPPESEAGASSVDPPAPPTPEQIAEVDALVGQAVSALRGGVPKGIRDAAAYGAAVKANKFTALVKNLNAWVGSGLGGQARMAAWEVLAAAEQAGARAGMTRAEQKRFDRIAGMYRATGPPDDMAQAA